MRLLLELLRFFMRLRQLRRSQWPCFRRRSDSRKRRRCAVLSFRASTRANGRAVLRLSLDVVLNAAHWHLNRKLFCWVD